MNRRTELFDPITTRELTVAAASRETGYTEPQIRWAIVNGKLAVERRGRSLRISEAELRRFVAADQLVR